MKQLNLIIIFFIIAVSSYSQSLKTKKHEVYLTSIIANEVNIAKSMYMTSRKQYFYEGEVEVNIIETNKTMTYLFYFTSWDDQYKTFNVRDKNYEDLAPEINFNDKETAQIIKGSEIIKVKLLDNSNIDYSVLSSVLVWLENQSEK